jgi:bacterioferritin
VDPPGPHHPATRLNGDARSTRHDGPVHTVHVERHRRDLMTDHDTPEDVLGAGIDQDAVFEVLTQILESELSGVVRYTHYSFMITGPHRIPLVEFMRMQAAESLLHAQQAGEILTGLGGHPSQRISKIEETHRHGIADILAESLHHEMEALRLYRALLSMVGDASVFLEEYARSHIGEEEQHQLELRKMLRDYTPTD